MSLIISIVSSVLWLKIIYADTYSVAITNQGRYEGDTNYAIFSMLSRKLSLR